MKSCIVLLFGFALPFIGLAESVDVPAGESESIEQIEFDSATLQAVTNLARSFAGVNATQATVEDNVAAILALLQSVKFGTSNYPRFTTSPFTFVGNNTQLGAHLNLLLGDDGTPNTSAPSRGQSLLWEIQRSIYGQSGTPSQSQSLLPVLWRMESALVASTNRPPQDLSWTNSLATINESINDAYGVLLSIGSTLDPDMSEALLTLAGIAQDTFESSAEDASSSDPALRVVDAVLAGLVEQLNQTAGSISSDLQVSNGYLSDILSSLGSMSGSGPSGSSSDPFTVQGSVATDLAGNPWWSTNSAFAATWSMFSQVYPRPASGGLSFPEAFSAFLASRSTIATDRDSLWSSFGIGGQNRNHWYSFEDFIAEAIKSNLVLQTSSSISNLQSELVESGYQEETAPTNTPLPQYVDLVAEADTSAGSSALSSGETRVVQQIDALAGMLDDATPDAQIVLFPAFSLGGINTREVRASLDTPLTAIAHRIMFFLWYVALFSSLFSLAQADFAYYASVGRHWAVSHGQLTERDV